MSFLISTPNGGLRNFNCYSKVLSSEFNVASGKITQITRFKNDDDHYLVLVRDYKIIEVYKYGYKRDYRLIKQFRNNVITDDDKLIEVGILNNQFLYSISIDGELRLRDIINDDDTNGFKSYKIASPEGCIKIKYQNDNFDIYYAGKSDKVYYHPITSQSTNYYQYDSSPDDCFSCEDVKIHLNLINYKPNIEWTSKIEVYKDLIITGEHWGEIKFRKHDEIVKIFKISNFSIINLKIFGDLLLFNDLMFKIGVINLKTLEIVNEFTFKGPIKQCKFYYRPHEPIIFIFSDLLNKLTAIKLFNDNTSRLVYEVQFDFDIEFDLLKWVE